MSTKEWCLKIKNTNKIIDDKNNGKEIGNLLCKIEPTVILQIIDSVNTMADDLINDMSLNEIQDLQSTLDDKNEGDKDNKDNKTITQLPSHMMRTQSSRTVRIGASKPKNYQFNKNKNKNKNKSMYGRKYKKTPKSLKKNKNNKKK
eukprot:853867_1